MTGNVWVKRRSIGPPPKWWQALLAPTAFIVAVTVFVFTPLLTLIWFLIAHKN